ncbi:MAG: hypothetical protein LC102_05985 [Ignavibacteriales bacterium]|jgi:hypothetical protein|nr:MAG: hypothetical protein F9K26_08865 [Ignavibacteriaceae bacterium]MBW7874184.1 hypothetical protein [Ignavibacteria bacterium]MCZ2142959.1 hypothetical protein [Ignavibacteriales bacterium]OQY79206.1 MAG: hypothetical protein B6D45_01310 [Ignavibacteriales bacterium UTCHB3]MBV6444489.1 hypothetical protein [Ignavibacteriaceae bacterium]
METKQPKRMSSVIHTVFLLGAGVLSAFWVSTALSDNKSFPDKPALSNNYSSYSPTSETDSPDSTPGIYVISSIIIDNSKAGSYYDKNGKFLYNDSRLNTWSPDFPKFEKISYSYDKNGNPITQLWDIESEPFDWSKANKVNFSYDEQDNLLSSTSYSYDGDSLSPKYFNTYTNDKSGKLLMSSEKGLIGFTGMYPDVYLTYDENGIRLTKKDRRFSMDSSMTEDNNYIYTYTFDKTGKKLTELCQLIEEDKLTNVYKKKIQL